MARILIVEDDDSIRRMEVLALRQMGHTTVTAEDGEAGIAEFARAHPDLIILDVLLPRKNGREVCREIRAKSRVPILMLTALAREEEIVRGLEAGADDYLTKPFGIRELQARITALLRRGNSADELPMDSPLLIGDVYIDVSRREISIKGVRIEATPTEFRLLYCLARNSGKVVPPSTLLREAQDYVCDDREAQDIVKVHIRHLRHKVEPDPENPRYILNVRGFGYMLEPKGQANASQL